MSGDNLYGQQPEIRYNVEVLHYEEWVRMDFIKEIENFPKEYLKMAKNKLSEREVEILEGSQLKSHEGMMYGRMYADWKKLKGFDE